MSDDYLWDQSGPRDPEIARLEELLRPFRQQPSMLAPTVQLTPDDTDAEAAGQRPQTAHVSPAGTEANAGRSWRIQRTPLSTYGWLALHLAAAALVLLAAGGWWQIHRSLPPGWEVTIFDGSPSAPSRRVTAHRDLRTGGSLETGSSEKALIKVAEIGNVNVDPGTRVRLIRTRAGDHRLELTRGTIHATILAPPGQFFVETPSATVVDLGCAYTLTIDGEGAGLVTVALGWVGFEWHGRESLIPAGFIAATRPGIGPGTPFHADTSPAVRDALEAIDIDPASPAAAATLGVVLTSSTERDEATLWHLLARVQPSQRDRVFDRLARFVPPPPAVTRDGIREGRRDMLDRWWDALGLGTIAWWRNWRVQRSGIRD